MAGTVFRFAKYATWPAEKFRGDAPFVIGVIGQGGMFDVLQETAGGKRIKNRTVIVRPVSAIQEIAGCHVLFVARSEAGRFGQIVRAARNASVLTIGEGENFGDAGGAVWFAPNGFYINARQLSAADLTVDSELKVRAIEVRGK